MPIRPDWSDLPTLPARFETPIRTLFRGLREEGRVEPRIDITDSYVMLRWASFTVLLLDDGASPRSGSP
jgi:hypothetical protein